jgi:branched-chain amino acid transport system ATP-binding protein
MLDVTNLTVRYGLVTAVHDVSLTLARGRIVTLIGSNGAGKTSTLRAIMGLVRPERGSIAVGDDRVRIDGRPAYQIARLGVRYVPEGRAILTQMTVLENLEVSRASGHGRDGRDFAGQLEDILTRFPNLRERLRERAGVLSGGERQMLAIARALIGQPKLLLLDEPSLGLSPLLVVRVFEVIRRLRDEGLSILLVEQNARKALELADHAYLIEQGSIVSHGPSAEFLQSDAIRRAYLGG